LSKEKPRTPAYRAGKGRERWEGIEVFVPLKEVQRKRTGGERDMEKEGRGQRQGESCSKILGG